MAQFNGRLLELLIRIAEDALDISDDGDLFGLLLGLARHARQDAQSC